MKMWFLASVCLLIPAHAMARCGVEVQLDGSTVPYLPSSPNIRIAVLRDGQPFPGAQVYITEYMHGERPVASVLAGADGVAALPKLIPGHHYHVGAFGISQIPGDLYLAITKKQKGTVSAFSINLRWPSQVSAAEAMTASSTLPLLNGIVQDSSGAAIPNAVVDVWKKGTTSGAPLEEVTTDSNGRFSAQLQNGTYIVLFSSPGFNSNTFVLGISDTADSKDLAVKLEVGECT